MQSDRSNVANRPCRRLWWQLTAALASVILVLVASSVAFGQGVTGRIVGTVEDQSQASVPGATVTVTNLDTGYHVGVPTGEAGDFVVPDLPPGKYKVTVVAKGFKEAVSDNVLVIVNGSSTVDFAMQVGSTSDVVEVRAVAPLVESTTSSMGNDLSARQVESLPLYGRVYSQLVDVMPGAVKTGTGSSAESGTGIGTNGSITASVNGMVYQGTTFTLDGVTDMELENAFQNITPPIDDIEEVKVSGNNSTADVGVYGGAQVNASVKSGTNQFHGSAYEYYRNAAFNANSWANDFNGVAKAPLTSHQYGGSIGGPILRNRLFFFGGFQGLIFNQGVTNTDTVPTALVSAGDFPVNQFQNGIFNPATGNVYGTTMITGALAASSGCSPAASLLAVGASATTPSCTVYQIPTAQWDPVATNVLAATSGPNPVWPAAQSQALNNNYSQNLTTTNPQQQFDIKVDLNLKGQDHAFVRASYARNNLNVPGPTQFISVGPNATPRDHNDAIGYTHWFSPTALNELRVGFDRFFTHDSGNDFGTTENNTLGIPNGNLAAFPNTSGIASLAVNSNQSLGSWVGTGHPGFTDAERFTNTYDIVDNVTLIHGKHTFGFGEDYRRLQAAVTNADHSQAGAFTFDQSYTTNCTNNANCSGNVPSAQWNTSCPYQLQPNNNPTSTGCKFGIGGAGIADFLLGLPTTLQRDVVNAAPATRLTIADAYFQDDYRATKKFTINVAIRWDVITQYVDKFNHQSNLNINTGLLDVATANNRGPDVGTNYHNFAPRIGFAYALDTRTVIRGAWGVSNFTDHFGADGGTLERNWPWFEEYSLSQQVTNIPWAQLSQHGNLPAASVAACSTTGVFVSNLSNCVVGLPGFVPQVFTNTVVPSPAASLYYVEQGNQPDKAAMWNFGIQRELTPSSAIDIAYVGTQGTDLFRSINIDQAFPGTNTINLNGFPSTVPSNINGLTANRIYATLGCTQFDAHATLSSTGGPVCDAGPLAAIQAITNRGSTGYSIYHSLQIKYTKRLSHGLETLLSYTWSKEIDDMTVFVPLLNQDQYNRALGNASAPDVPFNFIGSFVYELPFGKGRDWMTNASYPMELLLGGWQLSGIGVIQHGVPLVVTDGTSNNGGLNSGFTNRAIYNYATCGRAAPIVNQANLGPTGQPNSDTSTTPGLQWFGGSCFSNHTSNFTYGTSVPGNVWGPGIVNFDLSLGKAVRFRENMELKVQVDAFDAFNTPHFSNPNTTCCSTGASANSSFGVITSTASGPRQLDIGVHFAF